MAAPATVFAGEPIPRLETILLATDLTPASSAATAEAVELAVRLGARLLVISVLETVKAGVTRRGIRPEVREVRARQVQAVVTQARAAGANASYLVWEGEAGDAITAAAEAEDADLIVVGSHGRSTVGRFLLGSVSDHVVHHAGCPVLVVRPRSDEDPAED
jgi:nucleotide-binding universal stress UspA family protein